MGNTDETIYMIDDMPLDVTYTVMKSKRLHGSCGYYYILRMFQHKYLTDNRGFSEFIYVKVVDGDLYKYLENKINNWKFTVKRQSEIDGTVVINVNGFCDWLEYLDRPTS